MVVRRAHTAANVAPCLVTFGKQINTAYPKRDKASDGIWPSPAHTAANPNSDHEAGNAKDVDDDLLPGNESAYWDVWSIALTLAGVRDPRGKYLIHDDRFFDFATGKWRDYAGTNPHKTHMHLSIHESKRNDARPWVIAPPKPPQKVYDSAYYWIDADISATKKAAFLDFCELNHLLLDVRAGDPGRTLVSIHAGELKRGAVIAELAKHLAAHVATRKTRGGGIVAPDNTVRRLNPPSTTHL